MLIGLSGGADSVALLVILKQLAPRYGWKLYAAHFNHGIRGVGAEDDQLFCRDLNAIYLSSPALWRDDFSWGGFEWLLADRSEDNVIAYRRYGRDGETLAAVFNFSGSPWKGYRIPTRTERDGDQAESAEYGISRAWRAVLDSSSARYGGSRSEGREGALYIEDDGGITLDLEPLSAVYLIPEPYAGHETPDVAKALGRIRD